jgi:hypothetical protein
MPEGQNEQSYLTFVGKGGCGTIRVATAISIKPWQNANSSLNEVALAACHISRDWFIFIDAPQTKAICPSFQPLG